MQQCRRQQCYDKAMLRSHVTQRKMTTCSSQGSYLVMLGLRFMVGLL